MDQAIVNWINGTTLSDAAKAALLADAGFEQVYKDNVMTRSDYSRQSDQLKADIEREKAQLATDRAAVETMRNDNVGWKTAEEGRLNATVARAQATEARLLKAQQVLRDSYNATDDMLKDMGLEGDVAATLPPLTLTPAAKPAAGDWSREQWLEEANKRDMFNIGIVNQQNAIYRKHVKLYGNDDGFDEAELLKYALDNRLPSLEAAWEKKYDVAAKRAEVSEAAVQQRINNAVAAERAKIESEQALREQQNLNAFREGFRGANDGPDWQRSPFTKVLDKPSETDAPSAESQHRSRVDRALAVAAKARSGEVPMLQY